jgi:hypothetical protein
MLILAHHMLLVLLIDVIDGNLLFINRFDQNAMGKFNSPSHCVGLITQRCVMGNFNSQSQLVVVREFPITCCCLCRCDRREVVVYQSG